MKSLKFLCTLSFAMIAIAAFSQIQIDKSIQLTGSGADGKISGVKQVTSAQDAVSAEVLQNGSLVYSSAGGSANAITVSLSPAPASYAAGMLVNFKATAAANTGPVTINVNSLGVKSIKKNVSTDLAANEILVNQLVSLIYDGTNFQVISPLSGAGGTSEPYQNNVPNVVQAGTTIEAMRQVSYFPFVPSRDMSVSEIRFGIFQVAPAKTCQVQVGIYSDKAPGDQSFPHSPNLLLGSSTTGNYTSAHNGTFQTLSVSANLTANTIYWVAFLRPDSNLANELSFMRTYFNVSTHATLRQGASNNITSLPSTASLDISGTNDRYWWWMVK